jgi:peptidoglycan/LPS O-acetylase OafA/YrhL
MMFLARRGPRQLWLIILAAIALRALVFASGGDMRYVPYFTIIGRIDEFLLSILAAQFVAVRRPPSPWLMIQGAIWAPFTAIYLPLSRRIPASLSRLLSSLGTTSFLMCLVHFIIVSIVVSFVGSRMAVGNDPNLLAFTIGLVLILPVTIVPSRLTYAAIEAPFLDLRVRYLRPQASVERVRVAKEPGSAESLWG